MFESLWTDVRVSVRALRRSPAFTGAAVLTLALGIGATGAIFSILNAALLKPLPYAAAERMFVLTPPQPREVTGQIYLHVRDHARVFDYVVAQSGGGGRHLVAGGYTEYVVTRRVSENFFEAHGVAPLMGRGFTAAEDQVKGPDAVIVGERLWRRALGGTPDALGRTILLGDVPHVVVGVVPASFRGIPEADAWVPLRTTVSDNGANYRVIGRLRDGVTPAQAAEELDSLEAGIIAAFPRYDAQTVRSWRWMPYRQYVGYGLRNLLALLLAAVFLLLLIACVNVAGLQLTRALASRRAIGVRLALGGSRARIARVALVESVLLSLAGGAAGLALAAASTKLVVGLVSEQLALQLLSGETVALDWRVLGFVAAAAIASGLSFGVVPALASARADLRSVMIEGVTTTPSRRTLWLRRTLAGAELALACVLLIGAGLLVRTFVNLLQTDPGFNPSGVLVGRMSLQGAIDAGTLESLLSRGVERIHGIPGVVSVSVSNSVPVERAINLPIRPPDGGRIEQVRSIDWRYVTPEYFTVFDIHRVAGRLFDDRDTATAPPVVIVNEAFARTYYGGLDVVGRTFTLALGAEQQREIVGVVSDAKGRSGSGWTGGLTALGSATAPMMFQPAGQAAMNTSSGGRQVFDLAWSVRSSGERADLQRELQEAVRGVDPRMIFISFEPMDAIVARDLDVPRFAANLFAGFGILAAVLAAIGLYGLMAHAVSQRTREVGIRMALGASGGGVARGFVTEGIAIAAVAVAAGVVAAAVTTRALGVLLYGVTPLDASTFAAVAGLLIAVAALATAIPAARAARTSPVQALRTS